MGPSWKEKSGRATLERVGEGTGPESAIKAGCGLVIILGGPGMSHQHQGPRFLI